MKIEKGKRFLCPAGNCFYKVVEGEGDLFLPVAERAHQFISSVTKGEIFATTASHEVLVQAIQTLEIEPIENPSSEQLDTWLQVLHPQEEIECSEYVCTKARPLELEQPGTYKLYYEGEAKAVFWLSLSEKSHITILNKAWSHADGSLPLPGGIPLHIDGPIVVNVITTEEQQDKLPGMFAATALLFDAYHHKRVRRLEEKKWFFGKRANAAKHEKNIAMRTLSKLLEGEKRIIVPSDSGSMLADAISFIAQRIGDPPILREDIHMERLSLHERVKALSAGADIPYRRIHLEDNFWKHDSGDILVFSKEEKKPLVLAREKGGYYEVTQEGEFGKKVVSNEPYEPLGYIFYEALPEKNFASFVRRHHSKEFFQLLLLGLFGGLLPLFTPFAIDWIFTYTIPNQAYFLLWQIAIGFASVSVATAFVSYVKSFTLLKLEGELGNRVQSALWDKLLHLPNTFFRKFSSGDLFQRVDAVDELRSRVSEVVVTSCIAAPFSLLYLGVMLFYSWKLTLLSLIPMIVWIGIYSVCLLYTITWRYQISEKQGKIYSFILETLAGMKKIRGAYASQRVTKRWAALFVEKKELDRKNAQIEYWLKAVKILVGAIAFGIMYVFMAKTLAFDFLHPSPLRKPPTLGHFLSFFVAFSSLFGVLSSSLPDILFIIAETTALWRRASVIIETPKEQQKQPSLHLKGELSLQNVSFRYEDHMPFIIKNLDLTLEQGKFYAIAGESGCGKSTLFRLLLGLEEPQKGSVFYDTQNIQHINHTTLRRQVGVVLQNSAILEGSLRDNVACGRDVSDDEILQALHIAAFEEDLHILPMGLNTQLLAGGAILSGGQRQKIVLARAIVMHPKILFLDEATSALDNEAQAHVQKSLEEMNMTRIAIAHRLSTIRNADEILVLQDGTITERGSYDNLIAQNGAFAQHLLCR